MVASSGISEIVDPPGIKWVGASTCVPVCEMISILLIVTGAPSAGSIMQIDFRGHRIQGVVDHLLLEGTEMSHTSLGVL